MPDEKVPFEHTFLSCIRRLRAQRISANQYQIDKGPCSPQRRFIHIPERTKFMIRRQYKIPIFLNVAIFLMAMMMHSSCQEMNAHAASSKPISVTDEAGKRRDQLGDKTSNIGNKKSATLSQKNTSVIEFHVTANGSDSNPGTADQPFATIDKARDAIRQSGNVGVNPIVVNIHTGVYRLSSPLKFGPEDGGTLEAPVLYRSAGDGIATITGAQEISSSWEPWKNGIYRTRVKTQGRVDRFFVNGQLQHMARYPNFGAGYVPVDSNGSHRGIKAGVAPYNGCTPDAWEPSRVAGWENPAGAYLHAMHRSLWASMHFQVLEKNKDGLLKFEGGWQNNRNSPLHDGYRMVENVFEELDAPGEWYYDAKEGWLYFKPEADFDMTKGKFEFVGSLEHLVEVYGDVKTPVSEMIINKSGNGLKETIVKNYETTRPVKNIRFDGIRFTGTARTFMKTMEPLLRSDWTVYRGGAVHLRGTENIEIINSDFEQLGGNAVFIDGYNRGIVIRGNRFYNNGASDVNFVGSFAAVRSPLFIGTAKLDEVDTHTGPKSEEYPADCLVEDNLMTNCGRVEKQVAGVNISMSSRITVRQNSISHTPRAGINICDGTWGGHIIEFNDCFDTVLETSDHGAFNSWGRDRYWHSAGLSGPVGKDENGKPIISKWIEKYPGCPFWDAYQTTIIRNNRMQCDHGWDIDLDDGSSNYEIYNNLCLSGGIKTREGYGRIVKNNIMIGGLDCQVPYPKPVGDVFIQNILLGKSYNGTSPILWGGIRNANFFHNPESTTVSPAKNMQGASEDDGQSLYGNALFVNPMQGDFTIAANSPALRIGFRNFEMDKFGVVSERLKKIAGTPRIVLPQTVEPNQILEIPSISIWGAKGRPLRTSSDLSATGMFDLTGFILIDVPASSHMAKMGYEEGDVILEIDGKKVHESRLLLVKFETLSKGTHETKVMRDQREIIFNFEY